MEEASSSVMLPQLHPSNGERIRASISDRSNRRKRNPETVVFTIAQSRVYVLPEVHVEVTIESCGENTWGISRTGHAVGCRWDRCRL